MPTVTLLLPVPGTPIHAGLHADNYAELQAALNGNIDANNIANASITDPKLLLPYAIYTPAWTASVTNPTIGNGTIEGRYVKIGKFINGSIKVAVGSTTTVGSGLYYFSLPVNVQTSVGYTPFGVATFFDTSTGQVHTGTVAHNGTSRVSVWEITAAGVWMAGIPATLATGDVVQIAFSYEAAA